MATPAQDVVYCLLEQFDEHVNGFKLEVFDTSDKEQPSTDIQQFLTRKPTPTIVKPEKQTNHH